MDVHGRGVNNKINHVHERSLCIVYKDSKAIQSIDNLPKKDNLFIVSVTCHRITQG